MPITPAGVARIGSDQGPMGGEGGGVEATCNELFDQLER
jgi:hypothetical protein